MSKNSELRSLNVIKPYQTFILTDKGIGSPTYAASGNDKAIDPLDHLLTGVPFSIDQPMQCHGYIVKGSFPYRPTSIRITSKFSGSK